jgi:hypothetical protein
MGKVGGTYFWLQNLLIYFDDALRKLMKVTSVLHTDHLTQVPNDIFSSWVMLCLCITEPLNGKPINHMIITSVAPSKWCYARITETVGAGYNNISRQPLYKGARFYSESVL